MCVCVCVCVCVCLNVHISTLHVHVCRDVNILSPSSSPLPLPREPEERALWTVTTLLLASSNNDTLRNLYLEILGPYWVHIRPILGPL